MLKLKKNDKKKIPNKSFDKSSKIHFGLAGKFRNFIKKF